jgi:ABC-2 type transport system permease protein
MKAVLVILVALVVVAARLALRRKRKDRSTSATHSRYGPFSSDIGLVGAREVRERVRARVFQIGTFIILAVVAGAIVIPTLENKTPQSVDVGVVGPLSTSTRATLHSSAASAGTRAHLIVLADEQKAKQKLANGTIDVALIDEKKFLVENPVSASDNPDAVQFVEAAATELGLATAVEAAGLSSQQVDQLKDAKPIPVDSVNSHKSRTKTVNGTSVIGVILIFLMLTQYNTWILIGVMEEKSSRVIEVLLAAVRPIRLLTGKVLGIGLVAFFQAGMVVVFALVLAKLVGSDLLHGTAPLVVVSTLIWLVVGYSFYCWVYAAAGSMAERQDQVQSLAIPLSLPIIVAYILSLTAATSGSASTLVKVLAFVPPTAPFAMPVLVGLSDVSWWEFVLSVAITVVCTVFVARLATSVYRRAILRTGRRVSIRDVLRQAT